MWHALNYIKIIYFNEIYLSQVLEQLLPVVTSPLYPIYQLKIINFWKEFQKSTIFNSTTAQPIGWEFFSTNQVVVWENSLNKMLAGIMATHKSWLGISLDQPPGWPS